MEVWALEAYSASHILQEMITIKSDDVAGRTQVYEAIVKNAPIRKPNIPESFNVLIKELQAIGLDVKLLDAEELMNEEELIENRYNDIVTIEKKLEAEKPEEKPAKKTTKKKPAAKKKAEEPKEEKTEEASEAPVQEESKSEEKPEAKKDEK